MCLSIDLGLTYSVVACVEHVGVVVRLIDGLDGLGDLSTWPVFSTLRRGWHRLSTVDLVDRDVHESCPTEMPISTSPKHLLMTVELLRA